MIRDVDWYAVHNEFIEGEPFNHVAIDNFFIPEIAQLLSEEFPDFNDPHVNDHNNPLEIKKSLNHWDRFPPLTYRAFTMFGRQEFMRNMEIVTDIYDNLLWYDYGLNGGGWHMHGRGGNNNIHLDYNIHPKLGQQRKLNIIVYLTPNWQPEWGGGLELWSHDEENNQPKERVKTVENKFNRAVIFDTTQNSWHGLPHKIECPEGVLRKSIAAYYTHPAPSSTEIRGRALFAPRADQKDDPHVQELIRKRSDVKTSQEVYKHE